MFVEVEEIKSLTSFEEVGALSNEKLQQYIERADSWIYRATHKDYSESTNKYVQSDLKRATVLLVEYLFYWDDPEVKTTMMGPDDSVSLGSYKVNYKSLSEWKSTLPGGETGIKELDNILATYRYSPGVGAYFKVLGNGKL